MDYPLVIYISLWKITIFTGTHRRTEWAMASIAMNYIELPEGMSNLLVW